MAGRLWNSGRYKSTYVLVIPQATRHPQNTINIINYDSISQQPFIGSTSELLYSLNRGVKERDISMKP